jgi:iron-sulfur cluster insertion protein
MTQELQHQNPNSSLTPVIFLTERAFLQWKLIRENDHFIPEDHHLKVMIDGKGCNGFTYSIGFSAPEPRDTTLKIKVNHLENNENNKEEKFITLLMDQFTLFYLKEMTLDFITNYTPQDPESDYDGFVVLNHQENNFHGKFWVDAPDKIPTLSPR